MTTTGKKVCKPLKYEYKRADLTASQWYHQITNRNNPNAYDYQRNLQIRTYSFTNTTTNADKMINRFMANRVKSRTFKLISINMIPAPVGVTVYITYYE